MSVGRSAAWALVVFASLTYVGSADARARLADPDDSDDARPAAPETRRVLADEQADDDARLRDRDRDREGRGRVRERVVIVDDSDEVDDDRDDRADRRRSRGGDDREWFRDPGYYGYGNFPSHEVHDAVVANARAATARAIFRRAENALSASVRNAVRTFEGSVELKEALKAEKEAYEEYSTARRRALQSVLEDPKHRAIMSLRDELTDQINYKRANRSYDDRTDKQIMDDILAMATLKMNYAADAREMEKLALETDASHKDAQAKFRQASARVSEMRHDFDDALRNDKDLVAARRNLEDARIARLTASAYLKGAAIAAEEALDFAYYLNRYSRYNGAGYQDYRDYYPYSYRTRYVGY
jgi:hypothetical protein